MPIAEEEVVRRMRACKQAGAGADHCCKKGDNGSCFDCGADTSAEGGEDEFSVDHHACHGSSGSGSGSGSDDDVDDFENDSSSSFGIESPLSHHSDCRGAGGREEEHVEEEEGVKRGVPDAPLRASESSGTIPISFSDWNVKDEGVERGALVSTRVKHQVTAGIDLDAGLLTRGRASSEEVFGDSPETCAIGVEDRLRVVEQEVGGLNEVREESGVLVTVSLGLSIKPTVRDAAIENLLHVARVAYAVTL